MDGLGPLAGRPVGDHGSVLHHQLWLNPERTEINNPLATLNKHKVVIRFLRWQAQRASIDNDHISALESMTPSQFYEPYQDLYLVILSSLIWVPGFSLGALTVLLVKHRISSSCLNFKKFSCSALYSKYAWKFSKMHMHLHYHKKLQKFGTSQEINGDEMTDQSSSKGIERIHCPITTKASLMAIFFSDPSSPFSPPRQKTGTSHFVEMGLLPSLREMLVDSDRSICEKLWVF